MARERTLRAVEPGEKAPPVAPKSISEAVESGSSRDVLAAMRSALAKKLDAGEVSSNSIASAYKELRELDRLIRVIDLEAEQEAERQRQEVEGAGGRRRSFNASAV